MHQGGRVHAHSASSRNRTGPGGALHCANSGTGGTNLRAGIEFALPTGNSWSCIPCKGGSRAKLAKMGTERRPGTPAQFGAFIRGEKDRWAQAVEALGAQFD